MEGRKITTFMYEKRFSKTTFLKLEEFSNFVSWENFLLRISAHNMLKILQK